MKTKRSRSIKGFTLIEVMFAFLIFALSAALLLRSQQDSIETALESQRIIIASQLARSKLFDCKSKILGDSKDGFSITDFNEEGDFEEEGHKDMTWECKAAHLTMIRPNLNAISSAASSQGGGPGQGSMTGMLGTVFTLMSTNLAKAARELSVVVKFKTGTRSEEIKLTTHLVNVDVFSRTIPGIGTIEKKTTQPTRQPSQEN